MRGFVVVGGVIVAADGDRDEKSNGELGKGDLLLLGVAVGEETGGGGGGDIAEGGE